MTEFWTTIDAWVHAHPWAAVGIIVYVLLNVVPRPDPKELSGLGKAFWLVVDRLAILTREKLPGRLKMVLLDSSQPNPSPDPPPEPEVDEETLDTDPPAAVSTEEDGKAEANEEETKDDKGEKGDE